MLDDRNGILTPDPQQQQQTKELPFIAGERREIPTSGYDPDAPRQITDAELPDRPTVRQVAAWLGKSSNTIYLWAREGEIPVKRVGRSYLFDKAALLEWARPEEAA